MDDYSIPGLRESLAGFERVWYRVTGEEQRPEPQWRPLEADLKSLISAEAESAAQAGRLVRLAAGATRQPLARLQAEAAGRAGRLRAEYFIREGRLYRPARHIPDNGPPLFRLRGLMTHLTDLSQRYRAHPEQAAGLFQQYAAENERAAEQIRRLILQCF